MTGVQGCRNLGGKGGQTIQREQIMPTTLLLAPPPVFQTFRHPWSERVSAVEVTYLLLAASS